MEAVHSKEESKRLRTQVTDLRSKLNDNEARVSRLENFHSTIQYHNHSIIALIGFLAVFMKR